jgi:hypothetical protein
MVEQFTSYLFDLIKLKNDSFEELVKPTFFFPK